MWKCVSLVLSLEYLATIILRTWVVYKVNFTTCMLVAAENVEECNSSWRTIMGWMLPVRSCQNKHYNAWHGFICDNQTNMTEQENISSSLDQGYYYIQLPVRNDCCRMCLHHAVRMCMQCVFFVHIGFVHVLHIG